MNPQETHLARLHPERRAEAERLLSEIASLEAREAELLAEQEPGGYGAGPSGTKVQLPHTERAAALKARLRTRREALKTIQEGHDGAAD